MDEIKSRLIASFRTVFPDVPESQILKASPETVAAWDSVAAITLANVVEEEFSFEIDFDILADLNSFDRVLEYVRNTMPRTGVPPS